MISSISSTTLTPLKTTTATSPATSTTATATTAATTTTTTPLTDAQAKTLLQHAPFAPTDINLFRAPAYANATVYQPAAAPATPLTVSQLKTFIGSKMSQLYKSMNPALSSTTAASQGQAAANLMDDTTLKSVVPDPRLRAAVAMLKGTAADGAISVLKSGVFKNVTFVPLDPGTKAQAGKLADGTRVIQVNSRYQNEDPRELSVLLAHEVSHQDDVNSQQEETLNYALESMVYGQHVLADSTLPLQKTELTQRENLELMARMNDRDATTGNLRILSANGTNLYPNGNFTLAKFADAVKVEDPTQVQATSPGNAYLRSFIKSLSGKDLGASVKYDNTALSTVDASQTLFSLQQLIQIDKNLKLQVQ